jgi:hypothetical protein
MYSNWPRRSSSDARRLVRRGVPLVVEPLETRPLLSTVSPVEIMTPAVAAAIAPDAGNGEMSSNATTTTPYSSALTPSQIRQAYGFDQSSSNGSGTTIAIVAAYNDPNIRADLATFSAMYNLPAASLTVVNQNGQTTNLPTTDAGWSLEMAMDVEWAHAAAPGAKIELVEANSASTTDLMAAVQTAARTSNVVSMSWGGSEFQGETAYDTAAYFANPNVTFVAAAGDDGGAGGASWPAASPNVLSVGGTTLSLSSSGGYGSETAWNASFSRWSGISGSGGGVSAVEPLPSYQATALGTSYAPGRVTPDVSLDSNPSTGLSVYSSVPLSGQSGWFQVGGTSAAAPVWAGLVAVADSARAANQLAPLGTSQTLGLLYGLYGTTTSKASTYATSFHDVTTGANFAGRAGTGYDVVTGLGSPNANSIVVAASTSTTSLLKPATPAPAPAPTKTPSATTGRTLPSRAPAVEPAFTTTATGNTTAPVALAVVPVTTMAVATQTAPAASSTPSTPAASVAIATPASLPAQPLSQPAPAAHVYASNEESEGPLMPETPDAPGLFLDPIETRELGEEAPALAARPTLERAAWDVAVEHVLAEGGWASAPELSPPPVPSADLEVDGPASSSGPVALAGLAVAMWGTRVYCSRRSSRDRRRRSRADVVSR